MFCFKENIYTFIYDLNNQFNKDYFINIKDEIVDSSFGFIYQSPSVNFLRVIDEKSVCEAIKKYIQIKHLLLDNLDIIKKAEESESGTPLAELWNDLRVKIWNWKYSASFIFINDDKYVEKIKSAFSEQYFRMKELL